MHLIRSMRRNLSRHEDWEEKEGFEWTQWQALQIQSLQDYARQSADIINNSFLEAKPEIENLISGAFHEGAYGFDKQLAIAIDDGFVIDTKGLLPPDVFELQDIPDVFIPEADYFDQTPDETFFGVNKPKLDAVINDVSRDMNTVRYAAINRMGSGYQEIIQKADVFFQSGTMTLAQAVDMASKEFLAAGLNCVQYKDGRRVNIATYVEMALRASSRRAALTAEGAKRDEWEEHLVVVPVIHSTCPVCHKYQGTVMIDDVFASGKPDGKHTLVSVSIKEGFLHPSCRHDLRTYFEGITKIPKNSPYEQTRDAYKREQRKRSLENQARRQKRIAEGSIDPENQKRAREKAKKFQQMAKRQGKPSPYDYMKERGLTPDEQHAVMQNNGPDSYRLNEAMRKKAELTDGQRIIRDNLNSALEKLPVFEGTALRDLQMDNPQAFWDLHKVGEDVQYNQFLSATTLPSYHDNPEVRMYIQSMSGRDLRAINSGEQEVLFSPDSRFKVLAKEVNDSGAMEIYLEETR